MHGNELTGVRLGDEEENKSLLRSESRDVDILVFLGLQGVAGECVPNVNRCEVDVGGPLCGLVKLRLTDALNVSIRETLRGKYSNLFRTVFLAVFILCVAFLGTSLFARCGGLFGRFR